MAVMVAVFESRSCSSLNHGLDDPTDGVAVTIPCVGGVEMVSATGVVRVDPPETALIVTVAAPSVAEVEAVKVATTELPVVAVAGLNATVTPLGRPVALIVTAPVKLVRLIVMVLVPLAPCATVSGPDDATVKSLVGTAVTVTATG